VIVAAAALGSLLAPIPPAGALQRYCDDDPQGDVNRVAGGEVVAFGVPVAKADLRRYCATLGNRLTLRWRMPFVDPRVEEFWGDQRAHVWAGFHTVGTPAFDYVVYVRGPFSDSRFTVEVYAVDELDRVVALPEPCVGTASAYEADVKAIRASFPSSCIGTPAAVTTIGLTHRDPLPTSTGSYYYDESEEFTALASS
jgi:hypothetical protein